MPFIEVPECVLVEMIYATGGGRAENTLWYHTTSLLSEETLTDLAVLIEDWHDDWLRALQGASVQLETIKVTAMDTASSAMIEYSVSPAQAGTASGALLPSNVTGAITFITQFRGRSNRGRNFIIGLTEGMVVNDTIDPTVVAAWEAAYEDMRADFITENFYHSVVSRYSGKDSEGKPLPRPEGVYVPVSRYRMDDTVDSQRRRLLHRGR